MAGLSGLNFVDGAMRGAQLVAGMQDRQQRAGLMQAQEQRAQAAEQRAQESHSLQMAAAPDEMAARKSRAQADQMDLENKINAENARMMFHAKENGLAVPTYLPGQKEFFDKVGPTASAAYILDPRTKKAVQSAHGVMDGSVPLNSPDSHEALQTILPDIQSGTKVDGTVRVNGIYPSKDGKGLHIGLHVTKNDGTEDPHGVVTQNRTSDPKDPVRTVGTDGILQRAALLHQWQQNLSDPKYAQAYMDTYYPPAERLKDKEAQQRVKINDLQEKRLSKDINEGDPVTYQADGEGNLMQLPSRSGGAVATPVLDSKGNPVKAPQKPGFGANSKSSLEKEVEYLKTLGMTPDEALAYRKQRTGNDAKDTELMAMAISRQSQIPMEDYAPDEKEPDKKLPGAITQAINARQKIKALTQAKSDQPAPTPTGQPRKAPQAAIDELRKNPSLKDKFQEFYGYLPDGM